MSKSAYEIWLSFGNGAEKLRLPVLPSVFNVSNSSKHDSVDISKLGELVIIQDPTAKIFSFSSFFPMHYSSLVDYMAFPKPWKCVELLEKWKNSGRPMRIVVTNTPINFPVVIEDFQYREGESGVGDIDYDITFKEYKFNTIRRISTKKKATTNSRPNSKVAPGTYVVKKGDTLWALARKFYGNSLQWKKIWNANKTGLIKRDKRNIKKPGDYIHIGYKLVIPK